MIVPNLKILSQVVSEKSLTEKKSLQTDRHTNIRTEKAKTIYPLYTSYTGGIMKELEWSQHFPHYKCMGIFQDAQGQLTLQSLVRSGQISNLFETVWLSLLPA